MATEQQIALPTNAERIGRIRAGTGLPSDLDWLRVVRVSASFLADRRDLVCDCRCSCHTSRALTATGGAPGSCGLAIDLDTLDCGRACRSAHVLASDCKLDENR